MKINFDDIGIMHLEKFKGGIGELTANMYSDELGKILLGRLAPGHTIGDHLHDTSSEIIYFINGNATMTYDDTEEIFSTGQCHYCPKGHRHSMTNNGNEDVVFFAVVPEQ